MPKSDPAREGTQHHPHIVERRQKIKELTDQGLSRLQIAQQLGLSIYQVDYLRKTPEAHTRKMERTRKHRGGYHPLYARFRNTRNRIPPEEGHDYAFDQMFAHCGGENPVCAISGESIDWMATGTWQIDHIIPRCRGGTGNLENLQIVKQWANAMKGDLSMAEFVARCKQVCARFP